jgi:N-acetylmuramoyl-L-alanine amidase
MMADNRSTDQTLMAPRIAIVIGHNAKASGAERVTDGVSEFSWNGRLAEEIQSLNPGQVRVFRRESNPNGYTAEVKAAYAQVDAWDPSVSCELHFNAFNSTATGTETLYATNAGRAVAEKIQPKMVAALGRKDRGLVKIEKGGRGWESLVAGKAPAVIAETYFGSNSTDCDHADERFGQLARAILTGLGGTVLGPTPWPGPVEITIEERVSMIEARLEAAGI